ncbi:MAG: hypothetical protein AAFU77_10685 [Myxococcota bacterium]
MKLTYVATPALVAALTFVGVLLAALAVRPFPRAVKVSLGLGFGQSIVVAFSAWQTYELAISNVACLTAFFGWIGMAVLGVVDAIALIWLLWSRRGELRLLGFVLLRLASHWLAASALLWHAGLCTV